MWRKQDEPQAPSLPAQTKSTPVTTPLQTLLSGQATPATASSLSSAQPGCLTRLLIVEGEITGQDDLTIDGDVHGKIRLTGGKLTIGPQGRVTAEIEAPEVVVRGEVKGNIKGHDRVQIAATGKLTGEVHTKHISIEEGAEVNGVRVNLEREERPRAAAPLAAESRPDDTVQVPLTEKVTRVHV
jgi:cytoskeletal protein CcmA (bactofilin family)